MVNGACSPVGGKYILGGGVTSFCPSGMFGDPST